MSEQDKFLDRWSRRKREAAAESPEKEAVPPMAEPKAAGAKPPADAAPCDPASLPPIESITAESDIGAFLKPGVPPELTRAALRRVWTADPAIRDFIGPVENGWDFNDPNAMPGFGPIDPSEVARLLAQAIGMPLEPAPPKQIVLAQDEQAARRATERAPALEQSSQVKPESTAVLTSPQQELAPRNEGDAASQNDSEQEENSSPSRWRGHGGALPK